MQAFKVCRQSDAELRLQIEGSELSFEGLGFRV